MDCVFYTTCNLVAGRTGGHFCPPALAYEPGRPVRLQGRGQTAPSFLAVMKSGPFPRRVSMKLEINPTCPGNRDGLGIASRTGAAHVCISAAPPRRQRRDRPGSHLVTVPLPPECRLWFRGSETVRETGRCNCSGGDRWPSPRPRNPMDAATVSSTSILFCKSGAKGFDLRLGPPCTKRAGPPDESPGSSTRRPHPVSTFLATLANRSNSGGDGREW